MALSKTIACEKIERGTCHDETPLKHLCVCEKIEQEEFMFGFMLILFIVGCMTGLDCQAEHMPCPQVQLKYQNLEPSNPQTSRL